MGGSHFSVLRKLVGLGQSEPPCYLRSDIVPTACSPFAKRNRFPTIGSPRGPGGSFHFLPLGGLRLSTGRSNCFKYRSSEENTITKAVRVLLDSMIPLAEAFPCVMILTGTTVLTVRGFKAGTMRYREAFLSLNTRLFQP